MYIITFGSVMRSEVAAHLGLVNIHTLDRSTLAQGEGMITPVNYICKKKYVCAQIQQIRRFTLLHEIGLL